MRFVIADISDPKGIPQELTAIVPDRPSLVIVPLLQSGFQPWSMFSHIQRYPWVLPIREYPSLEVLLSDFAGKVLEPAERKVVEQLSTPSVAVERLR